MNASRALPNVPFEHVTRGYRLPGFGHDCVATYIPEFRHIWTNPDYPVAALQQVLLEEFVHATQVGFRPAELLPLLNQLRQSRDLPGHEEFRDLVETVHCAAYPLATGKRFDARKGVAWCSPYRALAERVVGIAHNLAGHHAGPLTKRQTRHAALWAVILCLLSIVPTSANTTPVILANLEGFRPPQAWSDSRDLLSALLLHLSNGAKPMPGDAGSFSLVRPNDLHQLLFRAVEIVFEFSQTPEERVVPTTPLLTAGLTLNLHNLIHVLWSQKMAHGMVTNFEVWSFTNSNIRTMERLLTNSRREAFRANTKAIPCTALEFHLQVLEFIGPFFRRRPRASLAQWVHEAGELFAALLQQVLLPRAHAGFGCATCEETFQKPDFRMRAERIAGWSGEAKTRLIQAAGQYGSWLRSGCIRLFRDTLQIPRRIRIQVPTFSLRWPPAKARVTLPTYAIASRPREVLAQFVPALGQIWILPNCPAAMMTQVLSHEITHHNQCVLNPAQNLHLRAFLLDRPMSAPDCFTDLVEASYVLGLTLNAGRGISPSAFPPAPRPTKQLAVRMSRLAAKMALGADAAAGLARSEVEAAQALLLVLWHVLPMRAGMGNAILSYLEQLAVPRGWRSRFELWPVVHLKLQTLLRQIQPKPDCILFSPMEPHRAVAEMLIFLAHALSPIPERATTVTASFPALMETLTFGSMAMVPVVRLVQRSSCVDAHVSILWPGGDFMQLIHTVATTQARVLDAMQQRGIDCPCTELFVAMLHRTAALHSSRQPPRLERWVRGIRDVVRLERLTAQHFSCPLCAQNLRDPAVQSSLSSLRLTFSSHRGNLFQAARKYSDWLMTAGLDLVTHQLGLKQPLRRIRDFSPL